MFGVSQTEARTQGAEYREAIRGAMASAASETVLRCGASPTTKLVGKVRDVYKFDKEVILISTDRLSAFDRHLASVPLKGRVLSLISSWWFRRVAEAGITKHHLLRTPHPNVAVVRRCTVFPVEFVVRGYMTVRPPRPPPLPPSPSSRSWCAIQLSLLIAPLCMLAFCAVCSRVRRPLRSGTTTATACGSTAGTSCLMAWSATRSSPAQSSRQLPRTSTMS